MRRRFEVVVTLKPGLADPQGRAIEDAIPTMGWDGVADVRVGKHVELTVADGDGEQTARRIAEALLANPVIEEFSVRVLPD